MTTSNPNRDSGIPEVTFHLVGEMVDHFRERWMGNLEGDLENTFPSDVSRDDVVAHIELLKARIRVLDVLAWGEATGDITITAPADLVRETLNSMLDDGDMGPITRGRYAVASTAFAIEDQIGTTR